MINEEDNKEKTDNAKDNAQESSLKDKLLKILKNAASNYAKDKTGDLLDELFLGNFKDACIDVLKREKTEKMSDEEVEKILSELEDSSDYKKAKDYAQLDSRKDDNTDTNIDPTSESFFVMWHSKDKNADLGKTLSQLVAEIQEAAKKTEEQQKTLVAELKKMKIDAKDEDVANFGPVLLDMINNKKSADEIKKKLEELRNQVKESFDLKMIQRQSMLLESGQSMIITEDEKSQFLLEAILENEDFQNSVANMMINEGFFGKALGAISKAIPDKVKQKVKDFGSKTIQAVTKGAIGPILSLGGLGMSIITGGWAAATVLKVMYVIEKKGKILRNSFERAYTQFANSKGVITKMDFSIDGKKDSKYSMRFYVKDMVWRVLNVGDQLKHPSKDFAKEIVNGEEGSRYRKQVKKIWDPIFSNAKGGKIDFTELFKKAEGLDIPEKQLQAFKDFADNYENITANCIESPKIDTRTQSLKKD